MPREGPNASAEAAAGRRTTPADVARSLAILLLVLGFVLACLFAPLGCAAYHVGTASLYAPDIRTVYVPVFESRSFRRNLGERLTEAVVKQIELKTPYKVVHTPAADSILTGTIVAETKRTIVEAPTDEPREQQVNFQVEITWIDRKGNMIREAQAIALPTALADVGQEAFVVPEVGQSIATGQQNAIEELAEQIVGLMEQPW